MRVFGWIFLIVGLVFAGVSVNAVLDPNTIFEGWGRVQKDPWVQGIVIGGVVAVVGGALLAVAPRVGTRIGLGIRGAIAVVVLGFIGFALFAPFAYTVACVDGPSGGGCDTQSWSTISGLTFDGDVHDALALLGAVLGGGISTLVIWRRDRPRTQDPNSSRASLP